MGEGIRIGGGGGVRGVLKTYPTEFGVSRGDLCSIAPTSFGYKSAAFTSTKDMETPNLVSVMIDSYTIFYASSDADQNSYSNLSLFVYKYSTNKVAIKNTAKRLIPLAAYRVDDNTIHLYCLDSTHKKIQVYNVDISTGTPVLGAIILSFTSSDTSKVYIGRSPGCARICPLGNNRYILFTPVMSYDSYPISNTDGIQCTPIYDDGSTIIKGTPIVYSTDKGYFDCCRDSETDVLLVLVKYNSTSSSPTFLKFTFSGDSNPILTQQEITVSGIVVNTVDNVYANNTKFLKLQDGTYGLVLISPSSGCQIAHVSIVDNVASIVGTLTVTRTSNASNGTAAVFGQKIATVSCSASASGTSNTGWDIDTVDMSFEPTVLESNSIKSAAYNRTGAGLSIESTLTTAYIAIAIKTTANVKVTKAKMLDTVEKNVNCVYANKNAVANTYGEFKVQE